MRRRLFLASLAAAACSRKRPALEVFNTVDEFALTDQAGQPFTYTEKLKGHVWVADFIFTSCTGPCPRMSAQMARVQKTLEPVPGAKLVSFTVDPANDTPEVLLEYARRYQANPARWSFLTGARETLHHLARNVFLLGNVDGELNHSTRFVLIDQQGRVRRYYDTTEADVIAQVSGDVRELASLTAG